MRVLYIDIDSLRPDHLGCYGYHRATSPNIDRIAGQAVRFDNMYISDAPCLPSRTALWSGRYGFLTGVVNHGGTAANPYVEGPSRGFRDQFGTTGWMHALRQLGIKTATVSSFGERHSAWHWYAGYNEIINPGYGGGERADQVVPLAIDWLEQHGRQDQWFLHVNLWDPHTPFRTPISFGNPFRDQPTPAWLTEEVFRRCWEGYGPHSPQEPNAFTVRPPEAEYPRHPHLIDSMQAVCRWFDGYDAGIRYADEWIGRLFNKMADLNIFDDTVIIIGADHGENIGELNVWGDHQTADAITCRVPLLIRWPGMTPAARVDRALHQHFDWAATLIELLGGHVPENWSGVSFAEAFKARRDEGRAYVVTSQGAWSCQRGVRFNMGDAAYLYLQTYHDGYKQLAPVMLFDLATDPHEQNDLARDRADVTRMGANLLNEWLAGMIQLSPVDRDPLMTVMREGGPLHTRGELPGYLERLRATGRAHHADHLAARHPSQARSAGR